MCVLHTIDPIRGFPGDVLFNVFRIVAIYRRPHPKGFLHGGNLAVGYGCSCTVREGDCNFSLRLRTISPNTVYPFVGRYDPPAFIRIYGATSAVET